MKVIYNSFFLPSNIYRIYVDIMIGEKLFRLQYPLAFIGRAVYPVGGKGMGEIVILVHYRKHFIKEH